MFSIYYISSLSGRKTKYDSFNSEAEAKLELSILRGYYHERIRFWVEG